MISSYLSLFLFLFSNTILASSLHSCTTTNGISQINRRRRHRFVMSFAMSGEYGRIRPPLPPVTHSQLDAEGGRVRYVSLSLSSSDTFAISRKQWWRRVATTSSYSLLSQFFFSLSPTVASPVLLPDVGEIEASIPSESDWPVDIPFDVATRRRRRSAGTSFARLDESPDAVFYSAPRFGEHVDTDCIRRMNEYFVTEVLRKGDDVLDLGASWTSHLGPADDVSGKPAVQLGRVAGLGMNAEEMKKNVALKEYVVFDLNADVDALDGGSLRLPYDDKSFDVVLCQLSIDYFVYPLEVIAEVGRVLRPGGRIHIVFSNRLFIEKAVGIWTGADDVDHAYTVGAYINYAGGKLFSDLRAIDLSKRKGRRNDGPITGDPLYAVTAIKK